MSTLTSKLRFNIGNLDRLIRTMLGLVLAFVHWEFTMWPAFWLGSALILTALFRFSPLYAIINWDTLEADRSKTIIPWEEFLDMLPPPVPSKEKQPTALRTKQKVEPELKPVAFQLPPELTQALIKDIEKNGLDEVLVVRFFENFFGCRVTVIPVGHLNKYSCQLPDKTLSLDFAQLKAKLLARLQETRASVDHGNPSR
ncbi:MAG: DUF2892 domain-containing protein [Betaproteobacteria bacterium]|nr:DUF2892 domain-containing protein [Betaproteobacteria bacterium]